MAESVDALVSNTSGCKAMPVRPRLWVPSLLTPMLNGVGVFLCPVVEGYG